LFGGGQFGTRRAAIIALIGIAAYTILVGADAAVVRATIMGGTALFASLVGRRQDGLNTLAVVGSDLYMGRSFTRTGDGKLTNLGCITRYDTTAGTWKALPNQGLNDDVRALAVVGSDLYVGGTLPKPATGR
jgi:hypothetical protein